MSGHSKWSTIKHKKAATDAKRGKIFTKLIKEITVAARLGGGDPSANPRLRAAIDAAKGQNMPKSNIERAVKKGTGELEGVSYEEITYEGYGPGGVAVLVETITEPGSVSWVFEKKGLVVIEKDKVDEETLMDVALEAGADDIRDEGSEWEVETSPEDLPSVRDAIKEAGIEIISAEVSMVPSNTVKLEDEKQAKQMLLLMEALEENDDVQNVYANFDIPEEILEKVA